MLPGFEVARRRLNPLMRAKSILGAVTILIKKINKVKNAVRIKRHTVADPVIIRRSPILRRLSQPSFRTTSSVATRVAASQLAKFLVG